MVSKVIGDFEPRLHWPLLNQFDYYPLPSSKEPWGRNIFACSAAELFGDWVPGVWIEKVFDVVRRHPEYNFLFATKFPARMAEVKPWPRNGWPGATITRQADVHSAEEAFEKAHLHHQPPFVTFDEFKKMLGDRGLADVTIRIDKEGFVNYKRLRIGHDYSGKAKKANGKKNGKGKAA